MPPGSWQKWLRDKELVGLLMLQKSSYISPENIIPNDDVISDKEWTYYLLMNISTCFQRKKIVSNSATLSEARPLQIFH